MARASLLATAALLTLAAPAATWRAEARANSSPSAKRVELTRDWAYAVAIQRDGKLVVAGRSIAGGWRFALARYTTRGRLDPLFGRGGEILTTVGSNSFASALAIQRDGKIVAAGRTYSIGGLDDDFAVVRYTSRGRLDASFGQGGTVQTSFSARAKTADGALAVAIQRDGKLVLAGYTGTYAASGGNRFAFALARYTARGTLDPTFGQSGRVASRHGALSGASGVAIERDGKIVAAGNARIGFALVRYTGRGKLDRSFGQGGTILTKFGSANAVAIQPDRKIVAVGQAASDFGLVRYTASGNLDRSFGNGGEVTTNFGLRGGGINPSEDEGLAVAIQHDGKLVVAGSSDARGVESEKGCCVEGFALARYTVDGRLDPSFGDGGKVLTRFDGISHAQGS